MSTIYLQLSLRYVICHICHVFIAVGIFVTLIIAGIGCILYYRKCYLKKSAKNLEEGL